MCVFKDYSISLGNIQLHMYAVCMYICNGHFSTKVCSVVKDPQTTFIDVMPFILCYYRNFDQLIPDAPELILNYLDGEQDASCKRNAFMMLTHVDRVSLCVCV